MNYFLGLVKKEFIEIRYSYKSLLFMMVMFAVCLYIAQTEITVMNNVNNICYIITFMASMVVPLQFLSESILSDKINQTFERYFVSGSIKIIMFAKYSALSVLFFVPFIVFYIYFSMNGIYVINTVYVLINTPLYYWIGLCVTTIISFILNDEKSLGFGCIPCLLAVIGLIYLNHFIETSYNPILSCIITIVCAVVFTFIAYKFYKNTKYFLKI